MLTHPYLLLERPFRRPRYSFGRRAGGVCTHAGGMRAAFAARSIAWFLSFGGAEQLGSTNQALDGHLDLPNRHCSYLA